MEDVFKEIRKERIRQNKKWGIQRRNPVEWTAILAEEEGEAAREAVDLYFGNLAIDAETSTEADKIQREIRDRWKKELIQVAAVAVQILEQIQEEEQKEKEDEI